VTKSQNGYAHAGKEAAQVFDSGLADDVLLVTKREAARRLSVSEREIDHARRRGDLAAVKMGAKVLISVDELRRFAESLPADEAWT
jgi:excisionase family DNA binding protein